MFLDFSCHQSRTRRVNKEKCACLYVNALIAYAESGYTTQLKFYWKRSFVWITTVGTRVLYLRERLQEIVKKNNSTESSILFNGLFELNAEPMNIVSEIVDTIKFNAITSKTVLCIIDWFYFLLIFYWTMNDHIFY